MENQIQNKQEEAIVYNLNFKNIDNALIRLYKKVEVLQDCIRTRIDIRNDHQNGELYSLGCITKMCNDIDNRVKAARDEKFSEKPYQKSGNYAQLFVQLDNQINHHQQMFKPRKKDKWRNTIDTALGNIKLTAADLKCIYQQLKGIILYKEDDDSCSDYKTPSDSDDDYFDQEEVEEKDCDRDYFKEDLIKKEFKDNYFKEYKNKNKCRYYDEDEHKKVYKFKRRNKSWICRKKKIESLITIKIFFKEDGKIKCKENKHKIDDSLKNIKDLQQVIKDAYGLLWNNVYIIYNEEILKNKQVIGCWITDKFNKKMNGKTCLEWRNWAIDRARRRLNDENI